MERDAGRQVSSEMFVRCVSTVGTSLKTFVRGVLFVFAAVWIRRKQTKTFTNNVFVRVRLGGDPGLVFLRGYATLKRPK